jgi:hypothetical protein
MQKPVFIFSQKFRKIFAKIVIVEKFFAKTKIFSKLNFVKFRENQRIFVKMEKGIFVSTLV